jgi:hypothetical protein
MAPKLLSLEPKCPVHPVPRPPKNERALQVRGAGGTRVVRLPRHCSEPYLLCAQCQTQPQGMSRPPPSENPNHIPSHSSTPFAAHRSGGLALRAIKFTSPDPKFPGWRIKNSSSIQIITKGADTKSMRTVPRCSGVLSGASRLSGAPAVAPTLLNIHRLYPCTVEILLHAPEDCGKNNSPNGSPT